MIVLINLMKDMVINVTNKAIKKFVITNKFSDFTNLPKTCSKKHNDAIKTIIGIMKAITTLETTEAAVLSPRRL